MPQRPPLPYPDFPTIALVSSTLSPGRPRSAHKPAHYNPSGDRRENLVSCAKVILDTQEKLVLDDLGRCFVGLDEYCAGECHVHRALDVPAEGHPSMYAFSLLQQLVNTLGDAHSEAISCVGRNAPWKGRTRCQGRTRSAARRWRQSIRRACDGRYEWSSRRRW